MPLFLVAIVVLLCGASIGGCASAPPLRPEPTAVYAVRFNRNGAFTAEPILIAMRGHYYKPPCFDERWSGVGAPGWLVQGAALDVVRGGRVVARAIAAATANAQDDGCLGMIVPLEGLSAEALDLRAGETLLGLSGPPRPAIVHTVTPLHDGAFAPLRELAADVLRHQGVGEGGIAVMKPEGHAVRISPDGVDEAIVTVEIFDGIPEDEDFHALFLIIRKHGDRYRPFFVEYVRVHRDREADFCSMRLLDVLGLDSYADAVAVVRHDCYEGTLYSAYRPWGRVYHGPYYGL